MLTFEEAQHIYENSKVLRVKLLALQEVTGCDEEMCRAGHDKGFENFGELLWYISHRG